jgi:hypothetical protein
MANRFPLVLDTTDGNKIKELPAGDNLNLRENSIVNVQDISALGTINASVITVNGERLVAQAFTDLTDTPNSFAGAADYFVKVNSEGTALELRPISDIGNIELDTLTVNQTILPSVTGTVNIGNNELFFNRITANQFKGDLIAADDTRVFNAASGTLAYSALEGAPQFLSEFTDDIGYLRTGDLDIALLNLFGGGSTFNYDLKGSVFADDSTLLVDSSKGRIVGDIEFNGSVGFIQGETIAILPALTVDLGTTRVLDAIYPINNLGSSVGTQDFRFGAGYFSNLDVTNLNSNELNIDPELGIGEILATTDLLISAGNRIKIAGKIPLNLEAIDDSEKASIVGINGDIIYNSSEARFNFYQNGNWVGLNQGTFTGDVSGSVFTNDGLTTIIDGSTGNIISPTVSGSAVFENDVQIDGSLTILGTTTTVDTENTTIKDNVLVLNQGELGAGVTLGESGIEIDRGSEVNVKFVYNETRDRWTTNGTVFETQSIIGTNGVSITTDGLTTGELISISPGGSNNFINITADFIRIQGSVEDPIQASAGIVGDVTGSVFADDSGILVDSVNAKIRGTVETDTVTTSGTVTANGGVITTEIVRSDGGNLRLLSAVGGGVELVGTGFTVTSSNGISLLTSDVSSGTASGITLEAADNTVSGNGGGINLGAGTAVSGNGGIVNIVAGNTVTGDGGDIILLAGGTLTGSGGDITIQAGSNSSEALGESDHGGDITIVGGLSTNGEGGNTLIKGGNSVNATGGNLTVDSGTGVSTPFNGNLNIGTSNAKGINIGNTNSTTTFAGIVQFPTALIANNLTADDSISITTAVGDGNAISIGPAGTNTFINLTADNIRFFGPVTTTIEADGGIVGDIEGSVFADDSTLLVDSVNSLLRGNIDNGASGTINTGFLTVGTEIKASRIENLSPGITDLDISFEGTVDIEAGTNSGFGRSNIVLDKLGTSYITITTEPINPAAENALVSINATASSGDVQIGTVASNRGQIVNIYNAQIEGTLSGSIVGSVFAEDSGVMIDAANYTMFSDALTLTPLNAAPLTPVAGMLVAADGVNWDPASKAGVLPYPVFYDGTAWNALY